jgi:uncharacterized transporter YbjL
MDLEQKSLITIKASPVVGRDINIKVKIFKKAFKNIDQDEKSQAIAYKSFKALSLQNIKLYQQKENYENKRMVIKKTKNKEIYIDEVKRQTQDNLIHNDDQKESEGPTF